jgi:hypothetical protein
MVGAHLQYQALVSDIHQLCASPGTAGDPAAAPYIPAPNENEADCPICSGLTSPVALASPALVPFGAVCTRTESKTIAAHLAIDQLAVLLPPARGPPTYTS